MRWVKQILFEGLVLALAGAVFAFSANWLAAKLTRHAARPLGLELGRNYFPEIKPATAPGTSSNTSAHSENAPAERTGVGVRPSSGAATSEIGLAPANPSASTHSELAAPVDGRAPEATLAFTTNHPAPNPWPARTNSSFVLLAARLRAAGMRLADSNQVARLFHDPRCEQNLVVFVDARDSEEYQQGHIPGAYLFNHYHPETYFPVVLPVCQIAQDIVVYCHGGDCEDSEFAAAMLRDAGIPAEKLLVYGGGFTEWSTNGLPIEAGERKSGQFRTPQK